MNPMPNVTFSIPKSLNEQDELAAIVSHLRQTFQLNEIKEVLLCQEIIAWHAQRHDIAVKTEEIQEEADEFRRQYRLEKASDTLAWLHKKQTSTEDFEIGLQKQVLRRKLAEHLFSKKAEEAFAKNQLQYERAILYQITFSSEALAYELLYRIQDQEISFFEVAHQFDTDEQRARRCGYEGEVSRWEMKPNLAAAAFGAPPGEIVGPVANDQDWYLLLIERVLPAELSSSLHQKLIDDLFRHWLEQEKLRWLSSAALKADHETHTSAYST
jgi:parvulin-like peptidyl-prolyl isomerase